jgi:hypothetical protein
VILAFLWRALAAVLVGSTFFLLCLGLGALAHWWERRQTAKGRPFTAGRLSERHIAEWANQPFDAYALTDEQAGWIVQSLRKGFPDEAPGVVPSPSSEGPCAPPVVGVYVGPVGMSAASPQAFIDHERHRGALS